MSSVAGTAFVLVFGLIYLVGIVGLIVAVVLTVASLVRIARATERIAAALEAKPPV